MKKIFLLFSTIFSFSFAAISDCKTDLYFCNGILTKQQTSIANAGILEDAIIVKYGIKYFKKHIGKVDYAYNSTHGSGAGDLIESLLQKLSIANLVDMASVVSDMADIYTSLTENAHASDLEKQVNQYKASIRNGHRVLVVAHSQGNLFAYEAYRKLPVKMQRYWDAVGVASPGMFEIKKNAPSFAWDNDLVADLALNPSRVREKCNVRQVYWENQRPYIGLSHISKRPNSHYVYLSELDKLYNADWKAVEGVFQKFDFRVHSFNFYMGEALAAGKIKNAFTGDNLIDRQVKQKIMGAISHALNKKSCPCSGNSSVPVKTYNGALSMTLSWTYQCDVDMDLTMSGNSAVVYDVKDVEDAGKEHLYIPTLYDIKPGDYYVFSAEGKQLEESSLTEEMLAEDPIEVRALLETPKGNYFNVWPIESFASLDLGDFAEVNVIDGIKTEWVCPALNNLPDWYNLFNTDSGKFQCIQCKEPYSVVWREGIYNEQGTRVSNGYWYCNSPGTKSTPHPQQTRTYNECSEEKKKNTCGCVPCEYLVSGLTRRVENGPIAGAKVEIIKVSDIDEINPHVLYRGVTTDDEDIFKSGLLEIPDEVLALFEDETYYLVSAEGGKDIDRDDDMARDSIATENRGTIHALVRGDMLKKLPFRVNVLTEAIYQVSGNSIGKKYKKQALENSLNRAAVKLINHKLYPGDDEPQINYKDILLWTPAVDKKALYKPFAVYVEPIIEKLYADEERFEESYRLIYEVYENDAPQLQPLALEIPEGLENGTVIAQLVTQNHRTFEHIVLQGNFSEHFTVDNEGYIHIAKSDLIEEGNRYRLQIKAVDANGKEGSSVSLNIEVKARFTRADLTTSIPRFVSAETFEIEENAEEGSIVANIYFEDSNQTIVRYRLTGEHNASFFVNEQGVVSVSANADIDYERSKIYRFSVSAVNDAGNESYPVSISIAIKNQLDTPLFDVVVFEHIEENTAIGSEISTIRTDREGFGKIDKFEILSPRIPFLIDTNGTIKVSGFIDYEQKQQYDFYAIARTRYGNSNKIEIHIVIDDQFPEAGVPKLEALEIDVDENVSAGSQIGKLVLDAGAEEIERIALYGEDDNFRVDSNGSIYLADDAKLDFESKSRYDLGARALNSRGYGNEVHIVVNVNNIADEMPIVRKFRATVDENVSAGTLIGKIEIGPAAELQIDTMVLQGVGSENFVVDTRGNIWVSDMVQFDYESKKSYLLKAVASSDTGIVTESEVIVDIGNVPDVPPVLSEFTSHLVDDISVGSVVGQMELLSVGDSVITAYTLSGDGHEAFAVDSNGTIRLVAPLDANSRSEYHLTVVAVSAAGESISVTVDIYVTVPDITKPIIQLIGKDHVYAVQNTLYTDLGVIAVDNIDGDISQRVSVHNEVDTRMPIGTEFVVSYNVRDSAGNAADEIHRRVTIVRDLNIDLSEWKANGSGNWVLQADNRTVLQTLNAEPTVYHNNVNSQSPVFELSGKITVDTASDDDFIGFVLGYHDGDLSQENVDYLLIDWKKGDQGDGKKGLAISRVSNLLGTAAWSHNAALGVTELQRGISLGNTGWKDHTGYIFRITFTSALVEVFIDDVKELSVTGDFSDGAYGFYNYSQGSVLYSAIQARISTNIPPVAQAGADQNITLGESVTLDAAKSSDDMGIVSYLWREGTVELSYDSQFVLDGLTLGQHRIILSVEDDEGLSDSDEVVVWVKEN